MIKYIIFFLINCVNEKKLITFVGINRMHLSKSKSIFKIKRKRWTKITLTRE